MKQDCEWEINTILQNGSPIIGNDEAYGLLTPPSDVPALTVAIQRLLKDKDLKEAISAAQREAKNAFGDERVFLEKYISKSRHIEVQILGDSHGNLLHLGERECSIQRRHQKIIEESPSSVINDEQRVLITEAALRMGETLEYQSAGTVEFLFDDETGDFFFLEVNTRLQVEHPVTEAITGIDLVREQLRISSGEIVSFTQEGLKVEGHAIEARLYAEDPVNDFLPATGRILAFSPLNGNNVRWDSGVEKGYKVGTDFDPMLSKVISWAPNRIDAINKLARGLEKAHFGGLKTNRDFLINCLRNESFIKGNTTTDFIDRENPSARKELTKIQLHEAMVAIAVWNALQNRRSDVVTGFMPSNWTNGRIPDQRIKLLILQNEVEVTYKFQRNGLYKVMDSNCKVHGHDQYGIDIDIDSHRFYAQISQADDQLLINMPYGDLEATIMPRFVDPGNEIPEGGLVAPMPGKVIDVKVKKGDKVKTGDTLIIIEAMKMEHSIKATENGKIIKLMVSLNQQVDNGATLLVLEN